MYLRRRTAPHFRKSVQLTVGYPACPHLAPSSIPTITAEHRCFSDNSVILIEVSG